jgi:methionyl aminopeptidase
MNIRDIKQAGKVAAKVLNKLDKFIQPGITGLEVNQFVEDYVASFPGYNLPCKGYGGFPASICLSINENIIHGIPSATKINNGDLVKVDIVVEYNGWFADTARTYIVGRAKPEAQRLVHIARESLAAAIKVCRAGNTTGDIGFAIENCAKAAGFSVMRRYCGHGIGQQMHTDPAIPNFGEPGEGEPLKEGNFIAVEPMLFAGDPDIKVAEDGWTVKSQDNSLTAHFEHTLLITKRKPVIITKSNFFNF